MNQGARDPAQCLLCPLPSTARPTLQDEARRSKKAQLQDGNKDADLLANGVEDTGRGKGKLGQSERVAWTFIHYQM